MEITPKMVMALRAATGLPMMKCKQALEAVGGDHEKALDHLRKEGLKAAESKAGRNTGEGLVRAEVAPGGKAVTLVLVRCETEPVRNTADFQGFVQKLLAVADASKPADVAALAAARWRGPEGATVTEALNALIAKVGENIQVGGVAAWTAGPGEYLGHYVHHDNRTAAAVRVAVGAVTPALEAVAKELCQHVVFSKPAAIDRGDIPAPLVEKEREIIRAQVAQDPKMAGKPAQIIDNVVKGKLESFFKEKVLPDQGWYKDDKQSVATVLKAQGATVKAYALLQVGA